MEPKPVTILVVDDDYAVAELLTRVLEDERYSVVRETSSDRALSIIQSTPSLKLIVSEITLPKLSGVEMIRQACRSRPELRILFITAGVADPSQVRKSDCILEKPMRLNEFTEAVHRALAEPKPSNSAIGTGQERRRLFSTRFVA